MWVPRHAAADEDPKASRAAPEPASHAALEWPYPEFGAAEIVVSGTSFAALVASLVIGPRSDHWQRRNSFDESSRDALRVPRSFGRQVVRDTSDALLSLTISYPYLIDALLMSAWVRESPKVGVQLTLATMEAMLVTAAIMGVTKVTTSRERPFVRVCGNDLPLESDECDGGNRFRSFFSGHAAIAFTAAGATCMHHAYVPIHGGGRSEIAPCAGMMLAAGATGLFRVMADQHFLSDVLMGAAVGTASGLFIPWVFHYRKPIHRGDDNVSSLRGDRAPQRIFVTPFGVGLGVTGLL